MADSRLPVIGSGEAGGLPPAAAGLAGRLALVGGDRLGRAATGRAWRRGRSPRRCSPAPGRERGGRRAARRRAMTASGGGGGAAGPAMRHPGLVARTAGARRAGSRRHRAGASRAARARLSRSNAYQWPWPGWSSARWIARALEVAEQQRADAAVGDDRRRRRRRRAREHRLERVGDPLLRGGRGLPAAVAEQRLAEERLHGRLEQLRRQVAGRGAVVLARAARARAAAGRACSARIRRRLGGLALAARPDRAQAVAHVGPVGERAACGRARAASAPSRARAPPGRRRTSGMRDEQDAAHTRKRPSAGSPRRRRSAGRRGAGRRSCPSGPPTRWSPPVSG